MKTLKIGIMPRDAFQKRLLDIASGRSCLNENDPKVWFSSMKSLGEVLSENNIRLIKLIAQEEPGSIKALSDLSGRHVSNLSRTLKKLEKYGIVTLEKNNRSIKPVAQATSFNILYAA